MRLLLTALSALAMVTAPGPVAAQDSDVPAHPSIPMPIAFDANGLSGPGGERIREEMAASQFVMVGEDHGFAEAALLMAALGKEGRDLGFGYYIVETGPFSEDWIANHLRAGGSEALGEALAGRALAIPFLNYREEADAAAAFLEHGELWGVDQEFIASTQIHLGWLAEQADNDEARALVDRWLVSENEAFATGNQGAVMMMNASPEDWSALAAAFAGNEDAIERIDALSQSATIYQYWMAGRGLDNNLDRIELLKNTFLSHYHAALAKDGKPPRALAKLGATHAGRATSSMNTFDLGSLVEGMAAANNMEALHIAFLPLGGQKTSVMPSPEGYFSTRDASAEKLVAALQQAGVDVPAVGEGFSLIALDPVRRALENDGLAELDRMTRFVLLGFDYLITTHAATPATPLALR